MSSSFSVRFLIGFFTAFVFELVLQFLKLFCPPDDQKLKQSWGNESDNFGLVKEKEDKIGAL